ncbi:MAG: T9SS type A sorting domain-containing protein [Bacteroidetes bacterium]|nr:T9SS type A sorting domain-containing protein [Bacteroidota bacterium]
MRITTLLIAMLLAGISSTGACFGQWQKAYQTFGGIEYSAILVYTDHSDKEIILASTSFGLVKSTDNGVTWQHKSHDEISSFSRHGRALFAGSIKYGIRRSTDEGETWPLLNNELFWDSVRCLAVHGNRLYAGTETKGVWVSDDGVSEWTRISWGLEYDNISALQTHNGTLYCAVQTPGSLYRLNERGDSWENVAVLGTGYHIWSFLITDQIWLVGTGGLKGGIYISDDEGNTWRKPVNKAGMSLCKHFVQHDGILWAAGSAGVGMDTFGIIRSDDNGETWTNDSKGLLYTQDALGIGRVNMISAGGGGLYYRSLSEITSVRYDGPDKLRHVISSLKISPHPVRNHFSLSVSLEKRTGVEVWISDLLGRVIQSTGPVEYDSGTHAFQYDLSSHPGGIYICHLRAGDEVRTVKILHWK